MSAEENRELISRVMGIIGSAKTEKKLKALAENRAKFTGHSEETKARLRESQRLRREREQAEREASGVASSPEEKRPPGRPRKAHHEPTTETAPKRGRGRPRKAEQATLPIDGAENGA